jgi:hypothetical protein
MSTTLSTVDTCNVTVDTRVDSTSTAVDTVDISHDEKRRAYKREWMRNKRATATQPSTNP